MDNNLTKTNNKTSSLILDILLAVATLLLVLPCIIAGYKIGIFFIGLILATIFSFCSKLLQKVFHNLKYDIKPIVQYIAFNYILYYGAMYGWYWNIFIGMITLIVAIVSLTMMTKDIEQSKTSFTFTIINNVLLFMILFLFYDRIYNIYYYESLSAYKYVFITSISINCLLYIFDYTKKRKIIYTIKNVGLLIFGLCLIFLSFGMSTGVAVIISVSLSGVFTFLQAIKLLTICLSQNTNSKNHAIKETVQAEYISSSEAISIVQKLKALYDNGVITQEEYEEKKQKYIGQI